MPVRSKVKEKRPSASVRVTRFGPNRNTEQAATGLRRELTRREDWVSTAPRTKLGNNIRTETRIFLIAPPWETGRDGNGI
jgi:hypothetical protein